MTIEEFEELAETEVSYPQYSKIETVYTFFDRWNNSKKEFVKFFKENGLVGIELLYEQYLEGKEIQTQIHSNQLKLNKMKMLYGLNL